MVVNAISLVPPAMTFTIHYLALEMSEYLIMTVFLTAIFAVITKWVWKAFNCDCSASIHVC